MAVHSLFTIQNTEAIKRNLRDVRKRRVFAQWVTNGLIAYRRVLKKAGLNYLICCSLKMTEIISTNFSHDIQKFLTFNPIHVAKNKVSRHFR